MKITLIDNWKQWYKMLSIWAFVLIGLAPELYNLAIQMNVFSADEAPVAISRIINFMAFAGVVVRLVNQGVATKLAADEAAEKDPS